MGAVPVPPGKDRLASTSTTARAITTASAATRRATRSASCARPRMSASWRRSRSWPARPGCRCPPAIRKAQEKADRRTELAEVMEQAVQYFRLQLKTGAGRGGARLSRPARADATRRRTAGRSALRPTPRRACWDHLTDKGVAEELVVGAGLAPNPTRAARPMTGSATASSFRSATRAAGRSALAGGRWTRTHSAKYLNSPRDRAVRQGPQPVTTTAPRARRPARASR